MSRGMDAEAFETLDDAIGDETAEIGALPARWTADHVALRLVEAFRTLDKMPRVRGPRQAGNHWPRHQLEWADQIAQAELPAVERREREARQNLLAFRPDGAAIARMDVVLDWLRDLRVFDPDLALVTTLWALRAARRRSVRALCREQGWMPGTFYKQRARALDWLACDLEERRVDVF